MFPSPPHDRKVTLLCVLKRRKKDIYLSRSRGGGWGEMPFGGSWFHTRDVSSVENLCWGNMSPMFGFHSGQPFWRRPGAWVVELFLVKVCNSHGSMKITLDLTQLSGLVDPWPYQNNTMHHWKHAGAPAWQQQLRNLFRYLMQGSSQALISKRNQNESTNLTLAAWHESRCATATSTVGPKRLCSHFRCVDDPGAQPWMGLISMPFLARRMKTYHRRP